MGNQQHVIQKLIVEIGLAGREEAFGLQTKITGDHQRLILSSMCEVFDKLVGEDEVVVINKLEIDLGNIPAQTFDQEFPPKIKTEIEEALAKLLFEARDAKGEFTNIRITTSGGDTVTVEAKVQQTSRSSFETLVYFLEYGLFPWSGDRKQKPSLSLLVSEAMIHHPDELRRVLQQLSKKRYVFRRLAFQLPADQLQYLAAILGSAFSSKLDEMTASVFKWIQAYIKQYPKSIRKASFDFSATLKQLIWEETLFYFAHNSGSVIAAGQTEEAKIAYVTKLFERLFLLAGTIPDRLAVKYVKGNFGGEVKKALENLLSTNVTQKGKTGSAKNSPGGFSGQDETESDALGNNKKEEENEVAGIKNKKDAVADKNAKDEKKEEAKKIFKSKTEDEFLPVAPDLEEGVYITNAGLVILAPYIPAFFRKLGYVDGKEFVDDSARWKAVHMLQWLADGDKEPSVDEKAETSEHDLLLNKIICGLDSAEPVPASVEFTAVDKEEGVNLLKAVIANWSIIKNSSVPTLRTTFLQKEGRLKKENEDWLLFVHRDSAVDMLIDKLPWGIGMIKLPWNKGFIYTEW